MITIRIEKELSFTRNKFKDEKTEVRVLKESEKTSALLDKIKKAKSSKIHFNNI